tara:strand:+ start:215 stop:472 length:258 start_codon:yes stop_codon:yes gene_type:complete
MPVCSRWLNKAEVMLKEKGEPMAAGDIVENARNKLGNRFVYAPDLRHAGQSLRCDKKRRFVKVGQCDTRRTALWGLKEWGEENVR